MRRGFRLTTEREQKAEQHLDRRADNEEESTASVSLHLTRGAASQKPARKTIARHAFIQGAPGQQSNAQLADTTLPSLRIRMEEGQTFQFRAYFGGNLRDERSCKWHGEHTIMVDWLNGELNCINWSPA